MSTANSDSVPVKPSASAPVQDQTLLAQAIPAASTAALAPAAPQTVVPSQTPPVSSVVQAPPSQSQTAAAVGALAASLSDATTKVVSATVPPGQRAERANADFSVYLALLAIVAALQFILFVWLARRVRMALGETAT